MAGQWNPEPSAIRVARMLSYHTPKPAVAFNPMVKSPRPPALKRASGGSIPDHPLMPHIGPIDTATPGRADLDPMHVPPGSYVMPADIVAHLGEGNTAAGQQILAKMFMPLRSQSILGPMAGKAPYGGSGAPYGAQSPKLQTRPFGIPRGIAPKISGLPKYTIYAGPQGQQGPTFTQARGGVVPGEGGEDFLDRMGVGQQQQPGTPINASGGEFVIPPDEVRRRGRGDIDHGHEILDTWVKHLRQHHIDTLRKLPGPAK